MGDKISIAEARARRLDPVWRRRHKVADLTGLAFVALLFVLPIGRLFWAPLDLVLALALLVVAPAALWLRGPKVGLDRRTAFLVAVPILNLFVLVPAVWRAAHLHLQRWQGPIQPPWGDTAWPVMGVVGAGFWLASAGGLVLSLL